jgi:hypothetical protein
MDDPAASRDALLVRIVRKPDSEKMHATGRIARVQAEYAAIENRDAGRVFCY